VNKNIFKIYYILFFIITLTGCLNDPAIRVNLDLKVGIADAGDVNFVIKDGLGSFHELSPGNVVIWAQSPVLEIDLEKTPGATLHWILTIKNCMPNAELIFRDSNNAILDSTSIPTSTITHKSWEINLDSSTNFNITIAPPDAYSTEPYKIALVSDIQDGVNRVQDIYSLMNQDPSLRYVISAGDLTHRGTVSENVFFQKELESLNIPFYSTSGNHDVGWGKEKEWFYYFGRNSFHFVFKNVHFSFADSADATIHPKVYDWIKTWLNSGKNSVHIFTAHIAPLDPVGLRNGSFISRREGDKLISLLVQGDVDLALYGHIHSYYAYSNGGIPSYISGGGGGPEEKLDGIGRHYLVIDIDPENGISGVTLVRVD
jgi:3',5'-cyclic-AMP phosphodiesterase